MICEANLHGTYHLHKMLFYVTAKESSYLSRLGTDVGKISV